MTLPLATTYPTWFYLLIVGWPVLNWICAVLVVAGACQLRPSTAWLWPGLLPVLSGAWMGWGALRNGPHSVIGLHLWGVFAPALVTLIGGLIARYRRHALRRPAAPPPPRAS